MYIWIIIAVLTVILDQASKAFIVGNVSFADHFTFVPGVFDIVYVKNTGAAFSILENHTWILGAISVAFSVAIVIYMLKAKPAEKLTVISAGLLLGGAIGNGIDRILRHYVVDFIELTLFSFPVFNLADVAITIGAALIVFWALTDKREKED